MRASRSSHFSALEKPFGDELITPHNSHHHRFIVQKYQLFGNDLLHISIGGMIQEGYEKLYFKIRTIFCGWSKKWM